MKCSTVIEAYNSERPSFYKQRLVSARKKHKCSECGGEIVPGTKYEAFFGVWDGDPQSYKTCADCLALRDMFFTSGYCYGFIWEDFRNYVDEFNGEIPENCIADLKSETTKAKVCQEIERYWENEEL